MNIKLDNYLVEKYPKIFINRYEEKTSMCGFEHNDGWFWLIDQLCSSIQSYIDINNEYNANKISQVIATQIKEKFGGLDFSFSGGDDIIIGMTAMIQNMSYHVCEFCGTTENIGTTKGWIHTICKECHNNADRRTSSLMWEKNEDKKTEICKELRKIKLDELPLH